MMLFPYKTAIIIRNPSGNVPSEESILNQKTLAKAQTIGNFGPFRLRYYTPTLVWDMDNWNYK